MSVDCYVMDRGRTDLLEERDAHTYEGAFPASMTETISPRSKLELEVTSTRAILKIRMFL